MAKYRYNQPDPAAMESLLTRETDSAAGTILRLAWKLGLLRSEIWSLTWDQVNFSAGEIVLAQRRVPLHDEMKEFLLCLQRKNGRASSRVVVSDRGQRPLTQQYISRLAREALDSAGQTNVRLEDLRHDCIVRHLGLEGWQQVARISGLDPISLHNHFMPYAKPADQEKKTSGRQYPRAPLDERSLQALLEKEGSSPVGLLLGLSWQAGLRLREIQKLTWSQVDLDGKKLCLPDRQVPLAPDLCTRLSAAKSEYGALSDFVILSKRAKKPMETAYLSKIAVAALVHAGLDGIHLSDLRADYLMRTRVETPILALAEESGHVTRNLVMERLGLSKSQAYQRLSRMAERGSLLLVGRRYFLPQRTVPASRHAEMILSYLSQDSAVRQDLARLLHILPRQVYPIMRKLIASGDVVLEGGRYCLSPDRMEKNASLV
ncbi:hypothetical protein SDC9_48270 [bioreactor metagenome]|uniref:Tyr recombinase domain-containing protein n=1 Tax=bioreactor metagenome TaxID=1076179 RepID=A0A644WDU8_9ZZZZ